ncbi:cytochrome b5 reductase-like isoform X2 [Rattus norvegicus]|uniref:cytochrome b5 reductase-like isoform X2 n=1 Tax=Rattus norvegicus TaxID=10116 RepID=UPI0003D0DB00
MAEREDDHAEAWLQLKPVEPLPSQCCGSGCSPCVFDLYYRDLERWDTAQAKNDMSLLSGKQPPESQGCSTKLSPETFLAFHISTMEKVTRDTYLVRFTLPGNCHLGLLPGQHLILRGVVDDLEIQRAYTPISPATAQGYFDVLIKCYETGLMSRYVESWRPGDTAFWRGPFGSFLYEPKKSITDNEDDETFVTLVGCFKTFEDIYLKTFFQEQARFWNVRTFFVLSQPWPWTLITGTKRSPDQSQTTWSPGLALLLTCPEALGKCHYPWNFLSCLLHPAVWRKEGQQLSWEPGKAAPRSPSKWSPTELRLVGVGQDEW